MWRKLLFFSLLYFIQGAALAYIINFQKPYLSGHGISKEMLGIFTSLLLIPFIAKVGLGYLSDRFPLGRWGSRKPYMIAGLTVFAASYASLGFLEPGQSFWVFAVITWLAAFGLAWFDTCADGWAVDVASDREQASVQAAMIAGKSAGLILMSAAFGLLAMRFGFSIIFWTIAAMAIFVLAIVLLIPQPKKTASKEYIHDWRGLLRAPYLLFAGYAVVYSVASFGTDGLLTLFLSEVHEVSTLGLGFFGMWRGLGALVGAVVFALANRWIGLRSSLIGALVLVAAACLLPLADLSTVPLGLLWGMAWGIQETAFVTLAMKFAQGRWAATLFATSMIFSNLGTSLGEALGAPLVPQLGFDGVFALYATIAAVALVFLITSLRLRL